MMNRLTRLYQIAKSVGWDNLPRRLLQAARIQSGWLRRRLDPDRFNNDAFARSAPPPAASQQSLWQERATRFLARPPAAVLAQIVSDDQWSKHVLAVVERAVTTGDYPFFNHSTGRLGWPPDFNLDPFHQLHWPVGRHWLETARSGPPLDDIKLVWEPSRFSLAFYLARAYVAQPPSAVGGVAQPPPAVIPGSNQVDPDRWAEAFWVMFDAWVRQNPPMLTVAWGCGQESGFRLMAMLFGAMMTLDSPAATELRLAALSRLAWQIATAVEININYARAQKNNHAISEATGLWTVGLLFPEFAQAERWRDRGRRILAAEVRRQIYDDGSYIQHSLNYHRVMTDDLLWAIRLGELAGQPLDRLVYDRLRLATDWLIQMINPASGRTPNYGANDGANVLPLSTCDYLDYRPVAQAAHYLLHRKRCFEPGPWDEKMLWLFGPDSLSAPVEPPTRAAAFAAPIGGYYILRGRQSWAMTRCHSYRDRPVQADMLHLDLWWRGENILRDGGSYLYYSPRPWAAWFNSTAAHNTVQIDSQDQMTKGPRFTWLWWTRAEVLHFEQPADGNPGLFVGQHFGYRRRPGQPVHRRAIARLTDGEIEHYVIVDDLLGRGQHGVAIRWRLCPGDWRRAGDAWVADLPAGPVAIRMTGPLTVELATGQDDPNEPEGWESLYYADKQAAPTLIGRSDLATALPLRIVTCLTLGQVAAPPVDQLLAVVEKRWPGRLNA